MSQNGKRRRTLVLATAALFVLAALGGISLLSGSATALNSGYKTAQREFSPNSPGTENGGAGGESAELATGLSEFAEARTAPGIVAPGAYTEAYNQLTTLPTFGGESWSDVTKTPDGYDADDPDYRDWYSNSSGGSGLVTGRVTGLAADSAGHVYAASAVGGVWRSSTGGGNWTPIADSLPSLSSGDLQLEPGTGALWYATGEANTGSTSYVGSGVYRLANPTSGSFTPANRVGGTELESSTINAIRFAKNGKVWIATLRGVYWHEYGAGADYSAPWHFAFAPNESYLPGGANAGAQDAAYRNIVSDVAIDPNNADHVLAGGGWKGGNVGNGFYETSDGGATWRKVDPQGGLDATDIGTLTFAYSANGKKLYAINQSPRQWNNVNRDTVLDGVYISSNGALGGPWNKIASPANLGNAESGSALAQWFGIGYRPGIQAWYNQFLLADPRPAKADHVFVGLEEVYETQDAGSHWATIGPYWNFYFGCWNKDILYAPNGSSTATGGCPQSTHSDQHTAAVGTYNGKQYLYVGNDGGVYRRPLDGRVNANNNATDWESLNDGTIDALQYYAVGVGSVAGADGSRPDINTGDNVLVSGGLQDNGGSLVRPGAPKMVSNFGGDGGDVLVDPNDGCNIVQEYVFLAMRVTETCANPGPEHPNAFLDFADKTTFSIDPGDVNARFIAPFVADGKEIKNWLAGGNSLWYQTNGFGIRAGSEWSKIYTFKNGRTAGGSVSSSIGVATALALSGNTALAGWCGSCQNQGFTRGVVLLTKQSDDTWSAKDVVSPTSTAIPNRYVGGAAIDPANSDHLFVVLNGFSRTFTEGPGAGIGHVFESNDRGATWHSIDGTGAGKFPDVPSNRILILGDGSLAVATDLGVVYRPAGSTSWTRLGTGLPLSVMLDLELGPDGNIYVASYGRGIWRIKSPVAATTGAGGKKR